MMAIAGGNMGRKTSLELNIQGENWSIAQKWLLKLKVPQNQKVSPVHLKVDVPFSLIHMSHGAATIRAIIIIHMNIDTLNT